MEDSAVNGEEIPTSEFIMSTSDPIDSRANLAKKIGIFGLVASLLLSLITVIAVVNHKSQSQASLAALASALDSLSSTDNSSGSSGDISWIPTGYTAWSSNSNVAYKWSASNSYQCDSFTCVEASIISQTGCSDLYAAVNWLDSTNGSVIGYGNATLPSLAPLQVAKLKFDDTSNSAKSAQMSDITCR